MAKKTLRETDAAQPDYEDRLRKIRCCPSFALLPKKINRAFSAIVYILQFMMVGRHDCPAEFLSQGDGETIGKRNRARFEGRDYVCRRDFGL